ncbi:helix-turn-helix domain-containing protein [Corynebacterium lipophiloflavum]|uniref:helix-turn-helix domain-containing protein n=1 Tax=Corynebacterium lipophiloflavum TaxID=161889 RepID=UPI0003045C76|nr:helix-turn-helix domain-containing protein [Corynebacterium lipophiloflavum]
MNTTTSQPRLVKVGDAAQELGITRKRLIRMIHAKQIKARKLPPAARNSPFWVPRSEIERVLREFAA